MKTKTLRDIRRDMSELYEQTKGGAVTLPMAAELANITGKHLKAVALEDARRELLLRQGR